MLNQKERWIAFYDQKLKPVPDHHLIEPFQMNEVLALLHKRQKAGNSVKMIKKDTAAIRITDMAFDDENRIACLLLQYADKNGANPVFSNLETGELREEPKLDGEGVAISSHMVISLDPNKYGDHLTLLENVSGLGKAQITPFLTSELKIVSDYVFVDEKNHTRKCRPTFELFGHMSESLKDSLDDGYIQGVELVRFGKRTDFDEPDYTSQISYGVKINCIKTKGENACRFLNSIRKKGKEQNYTGMMVRYKHPEGKQQTVTIPTDQENALDTAFSKMEIIKTEEAIPQCSPKIREDIQKKITALLVDMRQ